MKLEALVDVADMVTRTSARSEKIALLAGLLEQASPDEFGLVVGIISGDPRQGRIGVGWATIASLDHNVSDEATLTVGDLDTVLDAIASETGPGSQERRQDLLAGFLGRATDRESDFVRRLLLGELRQGASTGIVTDAVARATDVRSSVLRRAVMLSGDLAVASEIAARDGEEGLASVDLEVLRPIQPMLASSSPSVADALEDLGEASVEWKLDGIRIQVHRSGETIRVWTRNLNDITDRMPGVVEIVRGFEADQLVLDGEVLGFDPSGDPLAFQDTVSSGTSVVPYFFDLLHCDGETMLDLPLRERASRLAQIAGERAIPGMFTADPGEGEAVLSEALERGHEGVVVKAAGSTYHAGRRGKTWRKVKPVETLDLVVLAVEHGSGRRSGWLSNIHLGARDPSDGSFVMVGKTFKGMTDDMLRWQTERFTQLAVSDDGRVVRLRPEQVVEIALDGVQTSKRYPGGVALRFARVVRYRDDKHPHEVDTIEAVRALR